MISNISFDTVRPHTTRQGHCIDLSSNEQTSAENGLS